MKLYSVIIIASNPVAVSKVAKICRKRPKHTKSLVAARSSPFNAAGVGNVQYSKILTLWTPRLEFSPSGRIRNQSPNLPIWAFQYCKRYNKCMISAYRLIHFNHQCYDNAQINSIQYNTIQGACENLIKISLSVLAVLLLDHPNH